MFIFQPDAYLKSLDVAGEFSLVTLGRQDAVGNFLVCGHFCGMLARRGNDGMDVERDGVNQVEYLQRDI